MTGVGGYNPNVDAGNPGVLLLRSHSFRVSRSKTRRSGSVPVTPTHRSGSSRCRTQCGDHSALGISSGSADGLRRQVMM